MYKKYSPEEKLRFIKKSEAGGSIAAICREAGVSRTIFYRWVKQYKEAGEKGPKTLVDHRPRGTEHFRTDPKREKRILALALKNPSLPPQEIALQVGASLHGVWLVLKRHNLNTRELREEYSAKHKGNSYPTLSPETKLRMIQRHKGGESVVSLCKEYGVSRNILYRWLNRYEETGQESIEALASRRPRGEEHYRYVPEAPGLILNLVTAHPKYGNIEISRVLEETAGRHILGPTAVHNFLHSMQLSTYEQRVAYARTQAVPIPKAA